MHIENILRVLFYVSILVRKGLLKTNLNIRTLGSNFHFDSVAVGVRAVH